MLLKINSFGEMKEHANGTHEVVWADGTGHIAIGPFLLNPWNHHSGAVWADWYFEWSKKYTLYVIISAHENMINESES